MGTNSGDRNNVLLIYETLFVHQTAMCFIDICYFFNRWMRKWKLFCKMVKKLKYSRFSEFKSTFLVRKKQSITIININLCFLSLLKYPPGRHRHLHQDYCNYFFTWFCNTYLPSHLPNPFFVYQANILKYKWNYFILLFKMLSWGQATSHLLNCLLQCQHPY